MLVIELWENSRPFGTRCQPDRRGRGCGAACFGGEGAAGESRWMPVRRAFRLQVEAGGKKLIQITDNGCGMVRDDALLAFERHATSKIKDAEDLLSIATLGFRGEALPSIASVSRCAGSETRAAEDASGTVVEINGGKIFKVEEAGLPVGNVDHGPRPFLQCSGAEEVSQV